MESYIQVLIQWLMLFALISVIFFPAIMFRKIALANPSVKVNSHKKGWLYFLAGMGIGITSLIIARFITYLLMQFDIIAPTGNHVMAFILFVALPYLVVTTAVILFRRNMIGNN